MTDSKLSRAIKQLRTYAPLFLPRNNMSTTQQLDGVPSATAGDICRPGKVTVLKGSPLAAASASGLASYPTLGTGLKFDSGKEPVERGLFDYFPDALLATARVSAYGIRKYGVEYKDKGWRTVPDAMGRYKDARGRHILNESVEGPWDTDAAKNNAQILHAAQVAWNALAYLQLLVEELKAKGTYV